MKFLTLTILGLMLSAGALSAETYDSTRPSTTTVDRDTNNVRTDRDIVRTDRDNHTDWGWIGLLGLAGLAGLLPKNRRDDRDRNDPGNRPLNR